jgi:hypothetical protein
MPQLFSLVTNIFLKPADRGTMRVSVERTGILAASSLMEEDGVTNEQPITGLGELRVGERLFLVGQMNVPLRNHDRLIVYLYQPFAGQARLFADQVTGLSDLA